MVAGSSRDAGRTVGLRAVAGGRHRHDGPPLVTGNSPGQAYFSQGQGSLAARRRNNDAWLREPRWFARTVPGCEKCA
ncbi:hypothetical protein BN11_1380003 [Nostocoides australiense Ben110]|uniref:Uncharacterized protein n=1 Tax=Nostocoides australiense Ben110 TaxID=1193182 RepID=W6JTK4_9MICO|nr:hypothetical protein BN11_1380003 [Tetrasphaera australiensis Ben110]